MEAENRPSAALINKEWWESARKVLSYEEQGELLINAVEYVFCLLSTYDAADDLLCVDLGGSRIIKKKTTTKYRCQASDEDHSKT